MTHDRNLDWDGCFNARDLGGLRTADGRTTRWRAVVRSDTVDSLSAAGWAALWEYGVRTVVDLRGEDEVDAGAARRAGITTVRVPLDDLSDTEFWDEWGGGLDCTPLYYRAFLARFPQRVSAAVAAVAGAGPGGVLVHCGIGRDRTGLVALVLLALAGVTSDEIAADHELSTTRMPLLLAKLGRAGEESAVHAILARANTTNAEAIAATLDGFDVESYLRDAGLRDRELAAIRARLLGED